MLELASTRPALFAIVARLSFSTGTAYSRLALFEYGMAQIRRTPILGNGYNPFPMPPWMTGSTDNYWLMLAIVLGVPAFLFYAGAYLSAMIRIGRRNFDHDPVLHDLRLGWVIMMVGLSLTLATVALFGETSAIVLLIFGCAQWMQTAGETAHEPAGEPQRGAARAGAGARRRLRPASAGPASGPPDGLRSDLEDPARPARRREPRR